MWSLPEVSLFDCISMSFLYERVKSLERATEPGIQGGKSWLVFRAMFYSVP